MSAPTDLTHSVDAAERALRSWGDLTRDQAEVMLDTWKHARSLSAREREAVLARFPEVRR